MRRLGLLFALLLQCALPAWAESPASLTTLHTVAAMTNAQASQHMSVSFEATVIYFRRYDNDLFVQDGDAAIYVHATTNLNFTPGDRVLVRGTVRESFRPYVESHDLARLGRSALPEPVQATYQEVIRGETDCKLVTVRAHVLSADIVPNSTMRVPSCARTTTSWWSRSHPR